MTIGKPTKENSKIRRKLARLSGVPLIPESSKVNGKGEEGEQILMFHSMSVELSKRWNRKACPFNRSKRHEVLSSLTQIKEGNAIRFYTFC